MRDPWCSSCPLLYDCIHDGVDASSENCELMRWAFKQLGAEQTVLWTFKMDIERIFKEMVI